MGNKESKIYEMTVKHILYEKGYIQPTTDVYYYIDKSWYLQFCEYVRKERIEQYITKKIITEKYNNILDLLKTPKNYSLNQDKKPPKDYNLEVHYIKLYDIEENQINQILDVSKYIKINEEIQKGLINLFNNCNFIKYDISRFRLIIYNEKTKIIDEKYIKGEKEMVDIKLLEIYNNLNPIIIFSNQKEEIENYKKEYINLKEKIESLEHDEFYLIIFPSYETLKIKNLFGTMGLPNIGNNSYMNACIQCLSNVFPLSKYFIFDKYIKDINEENPMGSEGKIALCYAELIKMLWNQKLDLSTFNNKKCYYYDQIEDKEKLNIFTNLKNEIGKNNLLYNNDIQRDASDFFLYLIDVLHEDLNRVKKRNNNEDDYYFNENDTLEELYKRKYEKFKKVNDSIFTDIFYGMTLSITTCSECKSEYNIFEPYDIIDFPLKPNPYGISNVEADRTINKNNNNNNKDIYKISGKNNFYFCKCIIIPYNCKSEKKIIIYPIKKREYDKMKIKDINLLIMRLFNLENRDFITAIISNNNTYYKYICTGNEYLYEIFKKPFNLKIYFIQINMRIKELQLNSEMKEEKKLLDFFLNPKTYLNEGSMLMTNKNAFNNGEDEKNSITSLQSNIVTVNNLKLLKLISMIKLNEDNKFHIINLPRIISYSLNDSIKILYTQIKNCFQLGKENFSQLSDQDKLDIKTYKDLELYINENQNLNVPFILFFTIKKKGISEEKEYYIKIPFSEMTLGKFSEFVRNSLLQNDELKNFVFKEGNIYIIWLKYEEYIKEIENSFVLENIKEINPYEIIINEEIKINEYEMKNNYFNKKEVSLYEILRIYNQHEKYENENNFFCEKCEKNVIAVKKTFLYSLPEVIIFHFKRKENGNYNKIKINFPFEDLDLNPFSYKSVNKRYDLIGIINLKGDNNNGHYNCFCKNDITQKWYLFNDSACFPIEDLSKEIKFEEVCLLVYKNRNFKELINY